jgi:5-methyltetrahydropteroyltriglutamate--homocysteine methyltransferase
MVPPMTLAQYRQWAELRIAALNHAPEGLPPERTRHHICWGSWNGPHMFDVPLKDIVDLVLEVKTGALSFEAANPRHEHEWRIWKEVRLPPGKVLMPGLIAHSTNIVEHPALVAERLMRFAECVGRDNLWRAPIAGSRRARLPAASTAASCGRSCGRWRKARRSRRRWLGVRRWSAVGIFL